MDNTRRGFFGKFFAGVVGVFAGNLVLNQPKTEAQESSIVKDANFNRVLEEVTVDAQKAITKDYSFYRNGVRIVHKYLKSEEIAIYSLNDKLFYTDLNPCGLPDYVLEGSNICSLGKTLDSYCIPINDASISKNPEIERILIEELNCKLIVYYHRSQYSIGIAGWKVDPNEPVVWNPTIKANGSLSSNERYALQEQAEKAYIDPDYSIVTNYKFDWEKNV